MKLQFKEQQFQIQAVQAVVNCFKGQEIFNRESSFTLGRPKNTPIAAYAQEMNFPGFRNARLAITDQQLLLNIQSVQRNNGLSESAHLENPPKMKLGANLTIEMETGTGKTYTYIRTMYELRKEYGWNKFIVIVPSIAIREGVLKTFEITQEHFQEIYGHKIHPFIYNSKRSEQIRAFAEDHRISVMIINTQAFARRSNDVLRITREDEQFEYRVPLEVIAETNPVLIIDEPQRVDGEVALEKMQQFNPLFTLRYSATHKNVYNKIYRLDALDAYQRKLVKKIQVKGISLKGSHGMSAYLYLEQVVLSRSNPVALVEFEQRGANGVRKIRRKLNEGDSLYELSGQMPQYRHFRIEKIDGFYNHIQVSGQILAAGEAIGDLSETDFRRIQIRETIQSHLAKERQLFKKGIKVLSLFFIDSVEKYREYDENGESQPGEYARIFEEEYNTLKQEYFDLFEPEYNKFLHETNPVTARKMYDSTNYAHYLNRDDAERIHNGYFSIDKNKRMVNPSLKKGRKAEEGESDDTSAYDLIMKEKEKLLSFSEPTRFIFSHSALKEGWDNPNVFQICALKYSSEKSEETRRRQEVGRGMRLCVNDKGIRQDAEVLGPEEVHELNRLTIIAPESYESFACGLQSEIQRSLDRPLKITASLFNNRTLINEKEETMRVDAEMANQLYSHLLYERVIDPKGNFTEQGKTMLASGSIPLPDLIEPFATAVMELLNSIAGDGVPLPENDKDNGTISLNDNFNSKAFKELWEKISLKTYYEVSFDSEKLVKDAVTSINADLHIAERTYQLKTGDMESATLENLATGTAFSIMDQEMKKMRQRVSSTARYDIIGEIALKTNLTRKSIAAILKGIHAEKFALLQRNPEEFIVKTARLINEAKAKLAVNNIIYHKSGERYDAETVFSNTETINRNALILKKHVSDFLHTDSVAEKRFLDNLETSKEILLYAKLPKSFKIATPVMNYSPDWAIVFDKNKTRHIYFIAETKGQESSLELRVTEQIKIACAKRHFSTISEKEVLYDKVTTYDELLEIIQLKEENEAD